MMKTKILSFFLLTAILLTIGMISADVTFTPIALTGEGAQGETANLDLNIANDYSSNLDEMSVVFSDLVSGLNTITLTNLVIPLIDLSTVIEDGESLDVILEIQIPSTQEPGVYEGTLELLGTISAPSSRGTVDITLTVTEAEPSEPDFCENGAIGADELEIKKVKITNRGLSDDSEDNVWYPLDTIKVEVELENNDETDEGEIEDIVFVLGLFEEGSTADIADEMFWLSEDENEIEIGDIEENGEDDELTHTFEFRINPEDLEEGKYVLKIKAYSDKEGEDSVCIDFAEDLSDSDFGSSEYYAKIDIEKEKENDERPVVVDIDELPDQIPASCGSDVRLTVDVWNIGDEDQEQVKVTLFNEELGLNEEYEIREDMDAGGDKEEIDFTFKVPKDAEEKIHTLEFQTYYDYDEDDDLFDERSKVFRAYLKVEGNCEVETTEPKITAELDPETPEAIAGKQVIIKSTIKNTGDETTTYTISVFGNSAWSTLSSIDPQEITLEAGESEDVYLNLIIDNDAEGDKELTIKTVYNEQTAEQKVALSVEKSATAGITGAVVGDHVRTNWFIYLIAIINIILIIAIIAVVKSMVGRTPVR